MKNNKSLEILTILKEGVINDNNINNLSKLIGEEINLKKVKSRDGLYTFKTNGNTYNYSTKTKFFSTYNNGNELGKYDLAYFYFFVLNNTLFALQGNGTKELTYAEINADKNNTEYNMYEFDVNGVILKVKLPSEIHYDNKLYISPSYNKETNSFDYFTK